VPRNFSVRATSAESQFLPHAKAAGLAGMMKKMMYVTNVVTTNSTHAQRMRLIRYVSTASSSLGRQTATSTT
jgi:hypothetical protein